ncbi:aspartyl protease family protein At5g10770 [Sorghum bicolor]|uniref:aspartyl protease family protein At5g10770 n=1 Tax=Sorghum bicolor TaxID=4558 RepID=UPI000B423F59|nr:aspartyl protease family protein At5g10770 [Sorghum bicolor]|eukprot:XP_021305487.1 aspartyl protease family protein At5g10770 [Sorghum bicolor]
MASSPLLLCALLLCSYCLIALGGNEHGFVVVQTSTSSPSNACYRSVSVTSDPSRASMPLMYRHGPCAPASAAATNRPSPAEMLRRDRARRNHILRKASGRRITLGVSIPTSLGAFVDSLQYVVTLGFGTPAVPQVLLIDTGSDLSWVQCQPCNSSTCYPQKDPVFDPSASSTYAPVPCGSEACRDLDPDSYANGCTNSSSGASLCQYGIQYGNGDTTVGVYSTETLTLSPEAATVVNNFSFGCGLVQKGVFDLFDGLLGLGGAPESLVSQTTGTYGGAFSYCLPAGNSTAGFLALGAPATGGNNTAGFQFTPLQVVETTFYLVKLTGISVGGKQLDIEPTVFAGGMIIDSGTIVTGLPETAYSALRTAFRSAMSAYPLLPPNDDEDLDTCYDFTGNTNVTVPTVALTFEGGVTIDLDVPSGVLLDGCLAFVAGASDGDTGIIGNVNQRTFEVLYDSARGHVGFRAGAC